MISSIALTQELIRFDTINPPGNETVCARYLANLLEAAGFKTRFVPLDEGRDNLIATIGGDASKPPLAFTGHTDVVPLGAAPWTVPPFGADISGDKIYGRGSTDMKGGVAAFVSAAIKLAPRLDRGPGLVFVITSGEETGCEGAEMLAARHVVPIAGALVVAEPTSNRLLAGHKGVLWLEGLSKGVTAHGSMPHEGVNAVYKAARGALALESLDLSEFEHPVLGRPTVNVGRLAGGLNINSVPDEARMSVDVRVVPGADPERILSKIGEAVRDDVVFSVMRKSEAVWTDPTDSWMQSVSGIARRITGVSPKPEGAAYFTDAAVLKPAMGQPPTVVLGPGEPAMAHQTDEYCLISKIEQAEAIYSELIAEWCGI